ncbi:hypothetical protein [Streptomyces sp. NPDC001494]
MKSSPSGRRGRRSHRPLLFAVLAVVATGGMTAGGTVCVTTRAHSGARTGPSAATQAEGIALVEAAAEAAVSAFAAASPGTGPETASAGS